MLMAIRNSADCSLYDQSAQLRGDLRGRNESAMGTMGRGKRGREAWLDCVQPPLSSKESEIRFSCGEGRLYTGQAWRECSRLSLFPSSTARLLLWDGCEGAFLSEREQKTQFGSARYCLYGRNINKNPGDEVYRKEVVALDKCQTVTQFTLIL